jgi:PAS domain S-box-containing protein
MVNRRKTEDQTGDGGRSPTVAATLRHARPPAAKPRAEAEVRRLLHELEVHKEELEMQNAELRRAQEELAATLLRYTELYEHAPAGYVTLDARGRIVHANRAAAVLLGVAQPTLPSVPLSRFVAASSGLALARALHDALQDGHLHQVEVLIQPADSGATLSVALELRCEAATRTMRVVLVDVTEHRSLERAVQTAARTVQERISSELHDGLGQELTGLSLLLRALLDRTTHEGASYAPEVLRLNAIVSHTISTCRDVVRGLSPTAEFQGGLRQALQSLVELAQFPGGPRITFIASGSGSIRLTAEASDHLYRIAQECVNNSCKHSHARALRVLLDVQPTAVRLEVADDGVGISEVDAASGGLGLRMMQYRANAIHAELAISGSDRGGTCMVCTCPQPAAA